MAHQIDEWSIDAIFDSKRFGASRQTAGISIGRVIAKQLTLATINFDRPRFELAMQLDMPLAWLRYLQTYQLVVGMSMEWAAIVMPLY